MGEKVTLHASDGHDLDGYRTKPKGEAKAALVVIQEVFGVNAHIRDLCDGFAADGYVAIAPAVFDRARKEIELGYGEEDIKQGRALRDKLGWDGPMRDIGAAIQMARAFGKVGVIGYCWGGSLAWFAACKLPADAAVCYYGAQIVDKNNEKPRCPTRLHFGTEDASIPAATIDAIRKAHPEVEIEMYPGPHGFNCDHRAAYRAESAKRARAATLAFFSRHLS